MKGREKEERERKRTKGEKKGSGERERLVRSEGEITVISTSKQCQVERLLRGVIWEETDHRKGEGRRERITRGEYNKNRSDYMCI